MTLARAINESSPKWMCMPGLEANQVLFPPPTNYISNPLDPLKLAVGLFSAAQIGVSPDFLSGAVCCQLRVCHNFFEARAKSHTRVFASVTALAVALLAKQYLPPAFADAPASQAWKASFFSLRSSFTSGVHQCSWSQLLTATSTTDVLNMIHLDSMSPTSPRMHEKLFRLLKTQQIGF